MAETPARYCSNCGHELGPEDQFCQNCGAPVHRAARVPTPEADVPVPPPPQQPGGYAAPPQQAEGGQGSWPRRHPFLLGCLGLLGVLLLLLIALVAAIAIGGGSGDGDGGGGDAAKKDKPPAAAPAKDGDKGDENTSTLIMRDVKMATDENGENPTEVYSTNDTFYCVGYLENAPDDTKATAVWIASDIEGVEQDTKIKQFSATGGSGLFRFNLSPADSWPTGEYEVELYLNDEKDPTEALSFEVR